MNKKYTAINRTSLLLIANLPDKKGQISLKFNPGYGLNNDAYFVTDDKDIQDVLEKDARFNSTYKLATIDNMPVAQYNALKQLEEDKKTGNLPDIEPPKEIIQMSFDNINFAKDYLVTQCGVEKIKIPNPTAILNKAKELGFEFTILENNK